MLAKASLLASNRESQEAVDDYNKTFKEYREAVWGLDEEKELKPLKSLEEQFNFFFKGPDKKIKSIHTKVQDN